MKIDSKRYILLSMAGLYVLAAGVQIYACVVTYSARQSLFPKNFGNFESVREALPLLNADNPFTFAIVGDTRNKSTFGALAKDINKAQPAFVVILGDWVNGGSVDQHAYFRQKMAEYNFSCPVFFTPGNHDVDPIKYPIARFEKEYGPRNFSFVFNDNMFIFISHLDQRFSNQESLKYLRSLNPKTLSAYRNRFVFMHIPPWISPDIKERHTTDEKELMQIFENLNIDYAVAADFHGYNRTRLRGVEYIITGGGGGRLHEAQGQQFHHAIALTVGQNMLSERIIPESAHYDIRDWINMNSTVYVGPFLIKFAAIFITINIIIIFLFCLILKYCINKIQNVY